MMRRNRVRRAFLTLAATVLGNAFGLQQARAQEVPPVDDAPGPSSSGATGDAPSVAGEAPATHAPVGGGPIAADDEPTNVRDEQPETASEVPPIHGRRLLYFRELDYGAESIFNPGVALLNVGLGWYGLLGQNPLVQDIGSGGAMSRLVNAYVHPLDAINDRGFSSFVQGEFLMPLLLPVHANTYFHMLGEGMLTRKLDEYYLAHGLSRTQSTVLALGTMFVAQQLNELVEQQSMARTWTSDTTSRRTIDGADSLADSGFWNVVGMAAFQFDGFAKLFKNRYLDLAFWPGQAAIDVRTGRLFNQEEMYRTALKLPATDRIKLVWVGGAPFMMGLGLSARAYRDHTFGATFGIFVEPTNPAELARIRQPDGTLWIQDVLRKRGCLLLYWERNGSLMASLAIRGPKEATLNLYPGVVDLGKWRLGMYADVHTGNPSSVGLTIGYLPVVPGVQW